MINLDVMLTGPILEDIDKVFLEKLENFKLKLADNFDREIKSTTLYKDQTGALRQSMVKKEKLHFHFPLDYTSFVENGRGPIQAAPGKMLRFVINGNVLYRKSVGPSAPRPFIANAVAKMKTDYIQIWQSS